MIFAGEIILIAGYDLRLLMCKYSSKNELKGYLCFFRDFCFCMFRRTNLSCDGKLFGRVFGFGVDYLFWLINNRSRSTFKNMVIMSMNNSS